MSGITYDLPSPTMRRVSSRFTRRDFLHGAAAIAGGLAIDATLLGRHDIEVVHRTIPIARLPEAFHGFRIVQISDIHLDEYTEPPFLRLALHRINELAPDLVVLTGDFASRGPLPLPVSRYAAEHCAEILRHLACPLRFACLGNHDHAIDPELIVQALKASNIPVLVNHHVPIERGGQRIWICGVDDPAIGRPVLDLAVPRNPDAPVVLLSHAPDFADEVVRHPRGPLVDLMLSGHTHGGQIRLPFFGPLELPPMGKKYAEGLFRFNQMHLYVNRGIGTVGLPVRWNCRPELTHFTLQPVATTASEPGLLAPPPSVRPAQVPTTQSHVPPPG